MRLLVLSDIHANAPALEAVLADAARRGYDRAVMLGDALGYGAFPAEVLALLREMDATCIRGNHEQMLLDLHAQGGEWLPGGGHGVVGTALVWQLGRLSTADLGWVARWPDGLEDPEVGALFRHGTPLSLDTYTDSVTAARDAFGGWSGRLAFVGHTHLPGAYVALHAPVGEWVKFQSLSGGGGYPLPPGIRALLNPGSVGQPRDGDPRASYGLFDTARQTFEVVRVPYPVEAAQTAILEAGLPPVLAARLALGR
ncbi:metallophosphoesterase family protein [Deinococcus sp. MIMF12]|uniref:Metallophosphoesterase family protein n=1 Tax=Deinococcus rhizophilus TaxID=3049544 RepID=A0ABT7JH74_9DEIO|nr:metallophosphoesterase family protein [Deinococcus rhizophilus]MDL2343313.1 metallophosphoesterase family protein [Deinococcus rhizophilus]